MNIMELKVGDVGIANGVQYEILSDAMERRPGLGKVRVVTAVDQLGFTHKFIRGIEVDRWPLVAEQETR